MGSRQRAPRPALRRSSARVAHTCWARGGGRRRRQSGPATHGGIHARETRRAQPRACACRRRRGGGHRVRVARVRRDHAAGRQQAFRRLHRLQPPAPRVMCTNICPRHSPPASDHYPESPRVCAHAACTCNSTLSPPPRVCGLQLPSLRWPTMAPPPQRARGGARPREVRDGTGQGRCAASAHRPARRPPRPRRTAGCSAAGCSGCQGNAGGRGRAPFLSPPPVRWRRVRAGHDRGAYLVSWPSSSAPLLEYHEPACPARRLDDMFL